MAAIAISLVAMGGSPARAIDDAAIDFAKDVRPILAEHCYDCHGDGSSKGGVAFDDHASDAALAQDHELWARALKNVRAGLMPPPKKGRVPDEERQRLERWIKYGAFGLDPASPDPGRVTLRRLNRVEYRNTIRDLMGIDFRTDEEFPPDDSGHGFDNVGDVLTVSPLLLEKYVAAAHTIVSRAVPTVARVMPERVIAGRRFTREDADEEGRRDDDDDDDDRLALSYYDYAQVSHGVAVEHAGDYRIALRLAARGRYAEQGFDYNRCEVVFRIDGAEVHRADHGWHERQEFAYEFDQRWGPGKHQLTLEVRPLTSDPKRFGETRIELERVTIRGPADDPKHWDRPENYERFFGSDGDADDGPDARRTRARTILRGFASRAFRRPVDEPTLDRLVGIAESVRGEGKTFEAGVSHAMVAVLASPRFLFREEFTEPLREGERFPRIDEHSLATRLSYFLWSTMPDEQLLRIASAGELRANLPAQVKRLLDDPRSEAFIENFAGQWLQARDVEGIVVNARRVVDRSTRRRLRLDDDGEQRRLRDAMRRETEAYFAHVVRDDRSVLDLIDSDYTFLNDRLAEFYGIPGVEGREMRRVTLPPDSPRGGVLTMGTVLLVTSNPTRTSPVKRGLFILENILGTPPPPAPPDIPALEEAGRKITGREPTLREALELHRASPTCSSCHNRMDPIGLAFENFNALGLWRDTESEQPINAAGTLVSGESFNSVKELKGILVSGHRQAFYRCLTEKLLTYALGRGVEYYDVETIDQIVASLERDGGRFSTLLTGIIDSAPFQRMRAANDSAGDGPAGEPKAVTGTEQVSVAEEGER